ncbi:MAG: heparan-alpha-glucosaminide N-acetyltransferase [Bacillota bacterium]|nr:heparan-alpha-glucosaminide N-acetyltransferase [Bacillota bacterium]
MKSGVKRIELLDIARGTALILMMVHHGMYDLIAFYGFNFPILNTLFFFVLQFIFSGLFIFISGSTSFFSHSNFRRGIYCLAAGLVVTAASLIADPYEPIYFGILQMIGTSIIIFALLEKLRINITGKYSFFVWTSLFFLSYYIYRNAPFVDSPYLFIFGLTTITFTAADYFPLFPYVFLFFAGASAGRIFVRGEMPRWFYSSKPVPVVSFFGKHSIWVYLLHQPVLLILFSLIFRHPFWLK